MVDHGTSSGDGRRLRWEGHRDRRRDELVEIALAVIAHEGAQATVDQIASAAHVSRQVLYRQFDDRTDLDTAIAEAVGAQVMGHVTRHLDATHGIEDGLRQALDSYVTWVQDNDALYRFVRARESDPGTSQSVGRVRSAWVTAVAAVVDGQLRHSGLAPAVPVHDVFAVGTVAMSDAVVSHWLSGVTALTRDDLVDALITLISAAAGSVISGSVAREQVLEIDQT